MFYNLPNNRSQEIVDLICSGHFEKVYTTQRQIFAGYFQKNEETIFFRDTLGIIPLFYRVDGDEIKISIKLTDLVKRGDKINIKGALDFISFGSARLNNIVDGINICPPGSIMKFNRQNKKTSLVYKNQIKHMNLSIYKEDELLDIYKELFRETVSQNKKNGDQAIFLSGGIDSACISLATNHSLDAITALPWGENSSEKYFAKKNAEISGIKTHSFLVVDQNVFKTSIKKLINKYGIPLGSLHFMVMDYAFANNLLDKYSTIIFGQNLDTLSCAAGAQSTASLLPSIIRHLFYKEKDVLNFFLYRNSGHLSSENQDLINRFIPNNLTDFQKIILSGIFITHTPLDSEYFVLPSLIHKKQIFNPYYDLRIVEFFLGLKKRIHLDFSRETWKFPIKIDKYIQKKLWESLSDSQRVQSKKGFYLSSNYYVVKEFLDNMPRTMNGKTIKLENQRFAAQNFITFCNEYELDNPIIFKT